MNPRLQEALSRTYFSGLGLWWHLYPLLQRGTPYGYTDLTVEEMAGLFKKRVQLIRQGIGELKQTGVLIKNMDGTYTCPLMQDQRRNLIIRDEVRAVFARYRANGAHVSP